MADNYDDESELVFGSLPSFIPKDAPNVKPPLPKATETPEATQEKTVFEAAIQAAVSRGKDEAESRASLNALVGKLASTDGDKELVRALLVDLGFTTEEESYALVTALAGVESAELVTEAPPAHVDVPKEVTNALLAALAVEKGSEPIVKTQSPAISEPSATAPTQRVEEGVRYVSDSSMPIHAVQGGDNPNTASASVRNIAEGSMSMLGGLAALAGSFGRGIGNVARNLAADSELNLARRTAPSISVLPRISEYRVRQSEKMAQSYEKAMDTFWSSGDLPSVRESIEKTAVSQGVTATEVMAGMVPGGEFEGLRAPFVKAVNDSEEAQASKRAMDQALDSWVLQYSQGSQELLNPEINQNPDFHDMRARFDGTRKKMEEMVAGNPLFAGETKSHAVKFREAVERIAQKIKEMLASVVSLVRGVDDDSPSIT